MMLGSPLLLLAVASAIAAPPLSGNFEDYPVIIPQKRAALVLDRLLIALQKALRDEAVPDRPIDGPRAAPLRVAGIEEDMMGGAHKQWPPQRELGPPVPDSAPLLHAALEEEMRALQRRGQAAGSRGGRVVLRCYFNAITCF